MVPKLFWEKGLLGFYLRVEKEGLLKRGDTITSIEQPKHGITVRDLWTFVVEGDRDGAAHALVSLEHIDDGWKRRLLKLTKQ